jgi:hypothetical protein
MQPRRIFIPELSDEAKTWYIWIWNTFKPFHDFSKWFSGESRNIAIWLAYNLFSLFGCGLISFQLIGTLDLYFDCEGIIVYYNGLMIIPMPRSTPKVKPGEVQLKLQNELFLIDPPFFTNIEIAPGPQPILDTDIGRFKVKKLEPFYGVEPRLDIYLGWLQLHSGLPKITKIPIDLSIPSYSTSPIGIVFTSTDGITTKEEADIATKVLSAIYEQRRDEITSYVEMASNLLNKIFRGLTTYLLY